ncbi:MAG: OsmC family peroxiredoxin [Chloroflexota bacterium]
MAIRSADARWEGTLKEGKGHLSLKSGAFEGQYSFSSRFEEGTGTNPEELLGAAHAGCYSMALNAALERNGTTPNYVHTIAKVHMGKNDADQLAVTKIDLIVEADVPGLSAEDFQTFAEDAKANCIISRAINVEEMTLEATLK